MGAGICFGTRLETESQMLGVDKNIFSPVVYIFFMFFWQKWSRLMCLSEPC